MTPTWNLPAATPNLSPGTVHIWCASIANFAHDLAQLESLLSADERERAARFHFEKDRNSFVAGRGILRRLIGQYLGMPPQAVRFEYGARGKPQLSRDETGAPLCFNLSHSSDLLLYAFALSRRVGIDVERMSPMPDRAAIGARFFSPAEQAALESVPTAQRIEAFYQLWTLKESYIKALGDGLSRALDQFTVAPLAGDRARLLEVAWDAGEPARWSLVSLTPGEGYAAAFAVEGQDWRLECWRYGG